MCFEKLVKSKPLAEIVDREHDLYTTYPYSIYENDDHYIFCIKCKKKLFQQAKIVNNKIVDNKIKCLSCDEEYIKDNFTGEIKQIFQKKKNLFELCYDCCCCCCCYCCCY